MISPKLGAEEIIGKSFAIIKNEINGYVFSPEEQAVVTRVIHATTDIDYASDLLIGDGAIQAGLTALGSKADLITDVEMVKAGINKKILNALSVNLFCFINDVGDVKEKRYTRAAAGINKAKDFLKDSIVVIGNAPTALEELLDLVDREKVYPKLVVATPVGFVGAVEAKERLRKFTGLPFITNKSRKGGSAVAVAITNALLNLKITS